MVLLHALMCATITATHRILRRFLTDESVAVEWDLPDHWEEADLSACVTNAAYALVLLLLLLIFLTFPSWCYNDDFESLFLVSIAYAATAHGRTDSTGDRAIVVGGCAAWWWVGTPFSHAAVFYSIANAPFYVMLVLGGYNEWVWRSTEATAALFWAGAMVQFTITPNWADAMLLPLALYYDAHQWCAAFEKRQKLLPPHRGTHEHLF